MEVMKQLRQRAIRDLVDQRPIRTQQELAAALRERGFRTTQATISRDVAELGLVKLADLPVELREAGLLVVVKTLPGSAHAIAAALDRARWPEVAGSIAGDDTVFIACADRPSLRIVRQRIQQLAK